MATMDLEIVESPLPQSAGDSVTYTLTTTPWGSSPSAPSAAIYSYNPETQAYTDVTSSNMTGTASVASDIVTLPVISGLTAGTKYRVEVDFTISGNIFRTHFWIEAER